MKEFKNLTITGDTLQVICADSETGTEAVEFELDMKPCYFYPETDFAHNVLRFSKW